MDLMSIVPKAAAAPVSVLILWWVKLINDVSVSA